MRHTLNIVLSISAKRNDFETSHPTIIIPKSEPNYKENQSRSHMCPTDFDKS
jgi:hypothetical protein